MPTISALYQYYLQASEVTTDTRKIAQGSIFFALKGDNFNGNLFALEALANGAKFAVVDEPMGNHPNLLLVDNVLASLQELALHHRKQLPTKIIGITGTNGKTTTKELLHSVLSTKYKVKATEGNLNNHIGVPLSLLKLTGDEDFGIIEMGANHFGEIAELCEIALPDFGLITNIGQAHLEGFGSAENIRITKLGLFESVVKRNGTLFSNEDSHAISDFNYSKKILYSTKLNDSYFAEATDSLPFLSLVFKAPNHELIPIKTQLVGNYNLENILAACTIGSYFGLSKEEIIKGIGDYSPKNNRSEFKKTAKNELILDAYNANPSSMEKALENFAKLPKPNKVAILGDMFELGEFAVEEHKKVIEKAQSLGIEAIYVGHNFTNLPAKGLKFTTVLLAKEYIEAHPITGKLLLLKGSRGIKLEELVSVL